jgi:ABC-type phosphate transport system substrate-binding protein
MLWPSSSTQENDFVTNLSMEELALIFSDKATTWADVNPAWPAENIQRFIPGTDSGTYDYFIEEVMERDDDEAAERAASTPPTCSRVKTTTSSSRALKAAGMRSVTSASLTMPRTQAA